MFTNTESVLTRRMHTANVGAINKDLTSPTNYIQQLTQDSQATVWKPIEEAPADVTITSLTRMRTPSPDNSSRASHAMTLNESASYLIEKMMSCTPETQRYAPKDHPDCCSHCDVAAIVPANLSFLACTSDAPKTCS